jgi:hypothetical protein
MEVIEMARIMLMKRMKENPFRILVAWYDLRTEERLPTLVNGVYAGDGYLFNPR